jgi:signal transduction histidine kinase/HPt (histidine-containing phosphotransfer) domain-containing protein
MEEPRIRILYVEDDLVDQMVFEQFMKRNQLPMTYKLAASVADARRILGKEHFDSVILDYRLKDGNAFDIFEYVTNKAPIIFLSSITDLNLAVKAMRTGAYDYLVKDIERHYLSFIPLIINKAIAHKKADDDLKHALRQVEDSLKIKEQFLANISHEIRTPMNAIVGFAALLESTGLSAEQQQYIHAIRASGENLLVLINDILDFSRNRSGKITLEKIPFGLKNVLDTVHEMLLPRALEKKLRFFFSLPGNIPHELLGDPTRLSQVLINLSGNAIKFTEKGEVEIRAELAEENETHLELKFTVRDTGIGIAEEKLNTIFQEFTQASNDTKRKYGGSGLGLAIVKQLVELQGGQVSVKSREGHGSTFTFTLRLEKLSPASLVSRHPHEKTYLPGFQGARILVVEDNKLNQMLVEKHLRNWNCRVDQAETGKEAISKLEQNEYDLVLMDLQLPELDGYATTRYIRKEMKGKKAGVPILALTAHALDGEEEKCLASGMNGYLVKPFDPAKLNRLISGLLSRSTKKRTIDLARIRKILGNDQEFILKMMDKFILNFGADMARLDEAVRLVKWQEIKELSHKMLGSARIFQIKPLTDTLETMESLAHYRIEHERLPGLMSFVQKAFEDAALEMKALLPAGKDH